MGSKPKIIVGISGASGTVYGVRILEALRDVGVETHLILTAGAETVAKYEIDLVPQRIRELASIVYEPGDLAAAPASGSFRHDGMVVAPCSVKTLSAVANSFSDNLLVRAADVTLKERRRLVLMVRETPLHSGHLELMTKVSKLGGVIMPPVPAFYHRPASIDDIVKQSVGRALDQLGVQHDLLKRWGGGDGE